MALPQLCVSWPSEADVGSTPKPKPPKSRSTPLANTILAQRTPQVCGHRCRPPDSQLMVTSELQLAAMSGCRSARSIGVLRSVSRSLA
jgi:hypothetical protein